MPPRTTIGIGWTGESSPALVYAMIPGSTLVTSKVTLPPPPRQSIRRPRVERLLAGGADGKLVVVTAPAGFGKTTLVTSWLAATDPAVGWVSLDATDNDPERFWAYVTASLTRAGLTVPPVADPARQVTALTNALAELTRDLVLVLDDYHSITSPEIHQRLAEIIEQQLPRLHLILITRADPPFARSRWKANGEMVEIRARDLAFDDDEVALFLDDHGVFLDARALGSLSVRLAGWPAALRLVAIWISDHPDPSSAVDQFASSDATIADYLVAEVLSNLPTDLKTFLLSTSILPRLSGPLCDAVTGGSDGSDRLADIEGRDLFIQAMDSGHTWRRYHPLFQELLRNELGRTDPGRVPDLHRRASLWFAANSFAEDAINQGILAGDWARVRLLMLNETLAIGTRYPPTIVERWLESLPTSILQASAFFQLLLGYVRATLGNLPDAKQALRNARTMAATHDPDLPELSALTQAIKMGIARLECDLAAAVRLKHDVDDELQSLGGTRPRLGAMVQAVSNTALAGVLFWNGEIQDAQQVLTAVEPGLASGQLERMRVNALCSRALLLAATGRLREAAVLAPHALEQAIPIGVYTSFQTNPARLANAIVAMQRDEHQQALADLAEVRERSRGCGDRGPFLAASVLTARILAAIGEPADAFHAIDEAKRAWPGWAPPPALLALTAAQEAHLALAVGDLGAARAIHSQLALLPNDVPLVRISCDMTSARLLTAHGEHLAAAELFDSAAKHALTHGLLLTGVELLVSAAVAGHAAGDPTLAMRHLDRAVGRAADEDILAPFIWNRTAVRSLLMAMESGDGAFALPGFRRRLLSRLGVPPQTRLVSATQRNNESLSARELTVLRMLHGSLSNAEIAALLQISLNTLKTHVKNIHRKLGVENRRQAIARAEELQLGLKNPAPPRKR